MTYYNEHSKVWVSVDCIVFGFEENKLKVLIGRRQMDPGRGEWSLYGGFVGSEESLDGAAERTLTELTGMRMCSCVRWEPLVMWIAILVSASSLWPIMHSST